jgi:hypothetical protein
VSFGFPSAGSAELSALKAELKAARKATTLLRSPIRTLTIFAVRCCPYVALMARSQLPHAESSRVKFEC